MYVIIQSGDKQYRVKEGDIIEVEKLVVPKSKKEIVFNEVLLSVDKKEVVIGQPIIKEAKVKAEVLGNFRDKKIVTYKYKRRKSFHKTIGHRQSLTRLRIKEIALKKE